MINKGFMGLFLVLAGAVLFMGMLALPAPTEAAAPDQVPPQPVPAPIFDPNCNRPCPLWVRLPGGQRCRFVGCFVETGQCAYRC